MKHGEGKLYLPDGTLIEATWENGVLHGNGHMTHADGKKEEVIYYKDMQVKKSD